MVIDRVLLGNTGKLAGKQLRRFFGCGVYLAPHHSFARQGHLIGEHLHSGAEDGDGAVAGNLDVAGGWRDRVKPVPAGLASQLEWVRMLLEQGLVRSVASNLDWRDAA